MLASISHTELWPCAIGGGCRQQALKDENIPLLKENNSALAAGDTWALLRPPGQRERWAMALRSAASPCACPRSLPELLSQPALPHQQHHPVLTCFSIWTTHLILLSSSASTSKGPSAPFFWTFWAPGPSPQLGLPCGEREQ